MWLRNGAIFRLWHQNWCRFRERDFCCDIKIDAILITSSLIPSRLSHLARVIFKKFISSTYSQWEVTKLRVFFKNFFSHLFPVGEAIYQGVFEKTFKNSDAARKSGYCPFTYSMFESHFVTPSLIPSGKGIFLSSFQKNSAHLTHIWKPFCQPIRRGFLLQFLTATFATEKRHDFWKNFPSTLYRNFRSRKTTYFPKLFQKMFSPLYRTYLSQKRKHFFKKVSYSYTACFFRRI